MTVATRQQSLFPAEPGPLFGSREAKAADPLPVLHLIDVRFDQRRFWQALRHDGRKMPDWDLGYALHSALTGLFGPTHAPKPFHALPPRPGETTLRAVGQLALDPAGVERAVAQGPAAWTRALAEPVRTLAMPSGAALAGRTLAFGLRARPTVRRHKLVGGKEHDLELDAYQTECEHEAPDARRSRVQVYERWLAEQLQRDGACRVREVQVAGWQLTPVYRKAGAVRGQDGARRGTANLTLPQADFTGVLEVLDADRFQALLARGVGRHRAFGFGMLRLGRPGA